MTDTGKYRRLPAWALYFLQIGNSIVSLDNRGFRVVTAVALPTRAFAATFCAAGIVLARAAVPYDSSSQSEHLKRILSLYPGTPVTVTDEQGQTRRQGIYKGHKDTHDKKYLCVQIEQASELWLPIDQAHRISPSDRSAKRLPRRQKGRRLPGLSDFAQACLGESATEFFARSRLECLIIGQTNLLRKEITETEFVHRSEVKGTMQELIRVMRFEPAGTPYRTRLIPSDKQPPDNIQLQPLVAIFDGANGYLKWRHLWQRTHQIVLLDRTESRFDDAVAQLNQDYMLVKKADKQKAQWPRQPDAIDTMVYWIQR